MHCDKKGSSISTILYVSFKIRNDKKGSRTSTIHQVTDKKGSSTCTSKILQVSKKGSSTSTILQVSIKKRNDEKGSSTSTIHQVSIKIRNDKKGSSSSTILQVHSKFMVSYIKTNSIGKTFFSGRKSKPHQKFKYCHLHQIGAVGSRSYSFY
jgi:hypothetical protein